MNSLSGPDRGGFTLSLCPSAARQPIQWSQDSLPTPSGRPPGTGPQLPHGFCLCQLGPDQLPRQTGDTSLGISRCAVNGKAPVRGEGDEMGLPICGSKWVHKYVRIALCHLGGGTEHTITRKITTLSVISSTPKGRRGTPKPHCAFQSNLTHLSLPPGLPDWHPPRPARARDAPHDAPRRRPPLDALQRGLQPRHRGGGEVPHVPQLRQLALQTLHLLL